MLRKILTIQKEASVCGTLPYPWFVDITKGYEGNVLRQDFWRGRYSKLIGFASSHTPKEVTLLVENIVDTSQIKSLLPVFCDSIGSMFTVTDNVTYFIGEKEYDY